MIKEEKLKFFPSMLTILLSFPFLFSLFFIFLFRSNFIAMSYKLFIIYTPFEDEMVNAGDITNSEREFFSI